MAMGLCQFINQTGSDLEVSENHFHHNSPILYDQKISGYLLHLFLCMMSLLPNVLVAGGSRESYQERTGFPFEPP